MSGILWRIKLIKGGYNYINYYYLLLLFLLLYGSWKTSRFTPMNQNSRRTTPNSMVCPGQRHPSGPHRIPGVSKKLGPRMRKTLLPHFSWASFTATKMAFQDIPSSQYFATCRRLKLTRGGDDSEAPLFFMIHHEVITNAERSHHADVVVSAWPETISKDLWDGMMTVKLNLMYQSSTLGTLWWPHVPTSSW